MGPVFALGLIIFVGIVVIKPANLWSEEEEKKNMSTFDSNKFSLKSDHLWHFFCLLSYI